MEIAIAALNMIKLSYNFRHF